MSDKIVVFRGTPSQEWRDTFEAVAVEVDALGTLKVLAMGAKCVATYAAGHWTRATNGSESAGRSA
jgi:hypothetical protein